MKVFGEAPLSTRRGVGGEVKKDVPSFKALVSVPTDQYPGRQIQMHHINTTNNSY